MFRESLRAGKSRSVPTGTGLKLPALTEILMSLPNGLTKRFSFIRTWTAVCIAGLGALTPQALESKENFYEFVKQADEVAEKLGECGIKFIYHNHSQEFAKLDGKTMLDYMMENTCDNFNLVLDVYWAANAGVYPVTVMEKYAGRIPVIHYKDRKVVHWNDTDMCEVGLGTLDWDAIIDASERTGVEWAMVEQDWGWTDDDPFKALEISYKFLTEKGFI